jgi:hypothetical protein
MCVYICLQMIDWTNSFQFSIWERSLYSFTFFSNSNIIAIVAKFDQDRSINDQLYQFNKLEEERVIEMHHQEVIKQQYKAWHDHHLKKDIKNGDLVLLYDN